MAQSKEEIIRYVNEWVAQMKQKKHANTGQDFAEITVEEDHMAPVQEPPAPQTLRLPDPQEREIRRRFLKMRRLSRSIWFSKSQYSRMQAELFYRQAKLMADFEDDYREEEPFSMYFPDYQSMGYEQLRTYFTWRTNVRKGVIRKTSFSYVFVYLYELLNNVGVADCRDGLSKLLALWEAYRAFEPKLDRYLAEWVKDYFIVNAFSCSFAALVREHPLLQDFYQPEEATGYFERYAPFSAYPFQKSIFWSAETEPVLRSCFQQVMEAVESLMQAFGLTFAELVFAGRKGNLWKPYRKALYHPDFAGIEPGKTVRISDTELYCFHGECWTASKNRVCRENGRQMIGYMLKRIEQFYRKATGFRYQIKADQGKIDLSELTRLPDGGVSLFHCIDEAIRAHYQASKRKTVTVDPQKLAQIRKRAQITQEKLLVNPEAEQKAQAVGDNSRPDENALLKEGEADPSPAAEPGSQELHTSLPMQAEGSAWDHFAASLDAAEREALCRALRGASVAELSAYAKSRRIMLEVLVDGINEKAVDTVEDTIIDCTDVLEVFEEYKDELERVMFSETDESAQADHQHGSQRA